MKPRSVMIAVLTLILLLPSSAAFGQAPPGPTNPFHREFDLSNPPAQFDEIVLLGELAPGATTPRHTTGGDQYITVIAGELTRRTFGGTPAEKTYKAGDTLVEKAGEVQEVANAGTAAVRLLATILLPKGASLTTDQQTGATSQQLPGRLTAVYQARMSVDKPAAQFKVVQDELDFAPGAWVPLHTHGGQAFGLVLEGEFTDRRQDGEKKYKAGDSFVEPANTPHTIGNTGTVKANFFGTILLPPGAEIITIQAPPAPPSPSANVTVFASGLNNPRGLRFGPDGALYVAEGGTGGANSTAGICDQVVPPIGPYTGGKTARISKIGPDGTRTTVVETLPSSQTSAGSGGLVSGVADVAFVGDTLYGLLSGAGCSHGVPDEPNGIIKVNHDGTSALVADLSAFVRAHPVAKPNPGDFEPDETSYSMAEVGGKLYVVEPNHGALDEVTPGGAIRRVLDISASQGHIVPTAAAFHDGNFYVGNLNTFPVQPGSSNIYRITPSGQIDIFARGVTAVTGVAFDGQGRLYVLETDTTPGLPGPTAAGSGKVVRTTAAGTFEDVATGLTFPTAMTFGPDDKLYVSNFGFGLPPGMGQVVRVDVNASLSAPPSASPAAKPARLPTTGEADFPWLALAPAALILLCVGWWLRQAKLGSD